MSAKNVSAVRQVYEEGWNKGNLDVLDEHMSPDFIDHEAPPGMERGIASAKQAFTMYRQIMAETHFAIEDIVAEGDKVMVRAKLTAVHRGGDFLGVPPSNKPVVLRGIDLFRVVDGKLTDHWGASNMWDLATILGLRPTA